MLVAAGLLVLVVVAGTLFGPVLSDGYPLGDSSRQRREVRRVRPPRPRRPADRATAPRTRSPSRRARRRRRGRRRSCGAAPVHRARRRTSTTCRPGRRMPSFLGYHDFAALSGHDARARAGRDRARASGRACGRRSGVAAVAGVDRRRHRGRARNGRSALLLGGGIALAVCMIGGSTLIRRAGSLADRRACCVVIVAARWRSAAATSPTSSASSARHEEPRSERRDRTPSAPCSPTSALRIFLDHPLTGVGWQASELPAELRAATSTTPARRFPDVAAEALPRRASAGASRTRTSRPPPTWASSGSRAARRPSLGASVRSAGRALRGHAARRPLALARRGRRSSSAPPSGRRSASSPGVPTTALLWLAIGGAVALPRGGALPDDVPEGT